VAEVDDKPVAAGLDVVGQPLGDPLGRAFDRVTSAFV
jgi:hypothetical protein